MSVRQINDADAQPPAPVAEGFEVDNAKLSEANEFLQRISKLLKGAAAMEEILQLGRQAQAVQATLAGQVQSVKAEIARLKAAAADDLRRLGVELKTAEAAVVKQREIAEKFGSEGSAARQEVKTLHREKLALEAAIAELEAKRESITADIKARFGLS